MTKHLNITAMIKAGKRNPPPVSRLIGFRIAKVQKGRAVLTLRTREAHRNFNGTVHGGILCDLSDAAMGAAFISAVRPDQTGVTVEFKISFFKAVFAGDFLKATARILSHGRSLYFLECEIRNSKDQLIAKAASTCKITSPISRAARIR